MNFKSEPMRFLKPHRSNRLVNKFPLTLDSRYLKIIKKCADSAHFLFIL